MECEGSLICLAQAVPSSPCWPCLQCHTQIQLRAFLLQITKAISTVNYSSLYPSIEQNRTLSLLDFAMSTTAYRYVLAADSIQYSSVLSILLKILSLWVGITTKWVKLPAATPASHEDIGLHPGYFTSVAAPS